jgi:hypothetical protein
VSFRYAGADNDASGASPPGEYPAAEPLRLQWNTPLPGAAAYPIPLELTVETTYDDGTVRTYAFEGSIEVVVIYSSITH